MNEVVPQLIEQTVMADDTTGSERKREAAETSDAPSAKVPKTEVSADCVEHGVAYVEHAACSVTEWCELWESFRDVKTMQWRCSSTSTITNGHRKRSLQAVMNPFFRQRSTRPRSLNGQTLIDKGAVRVVPAKESAWIRRHQAHRIMGSRFVIVKKPEEDLVETGQAVDPNNLNHWKVKARWCLQGHLDPDLSAKATAGQLQSPTLSQMGRTVLFQLMSSHRWQLQLGDVKGAFLEAGTLA